MGASLNTGGTGKAGRRSRARRHAPMSEINVTPFVDVMLVLLIIFMVAAPLLTVGVPLELQQELWPTEDYHLALSHVPTELPEDDLFAGLRARVPA